MEHIAARIEHAIDAGPHRQLPHHPANDPRTALEVGLVPLLAAAADHVGGLLFVEPVGSLGANHDVACRRSRCGSTEERRAGKEGVSACRTRWATYQEKQKIKK